MNKSDQLLSNLKSAPIIAILRGVSPNKVLEVGNLLVSSGIRVIEVPLNSPDAFTSIAALRGHFSPDITVGAGTVLTVADVEKIAKAGAEICISPNLDLEVISTAQKLGLIPIPGVATSSEFFEAYKHGVKAMKLFPFSNLGISFMKALQSVSPKDSHLIPVGGVSVEDTFELVQSGALAVGIGGSLYDPKISNDQFIERCSSAKKELSKFA